MTCESDLIEKNFGLVHSIIHNRYSWLMNYYDYDDLFQVGCIGLLAAAKKYKGDLKTKYSFSTIAFGHITRSLYKVARKHYAKKKVPVDKVVFLEDYINENQTVSDFIHNNDCNFEDVENKLILHQLLNKLPKKEMVVLRLMLKGYNQNEISRIIKVTQSSVSRIKEKAIKKVRNYAKEVKYADI